MSYHCDESYDVYHEIRVIARKVHECDAVLCDQPIPVGAQYWRISVVYDGRAETIKRCVRCQAIHEHLRTLAPGSTWPDERLACGLDYEEEWGAPPPAEIQALAFWRPGEPLPQRNPSTFEDRHGGRREAMCREYRGLYGSRVEARCVRDRGWV